LRQRYFFVALILLALAAPPVGAAARSTFSPGPLSGSVPQDELWLSGPFGRVLGGSNEHPAVALPASIALDTFARRAPLVLDAGGAGLQDGQVEIRSVPDPRSEPGTRDGEVLGSGRLLPEGLAFEGPDEPGSWTIVAVLERADGQMSERAWHVTVPDRELPDDGIIDIPAPVALLNGNRDSIAGMPQDGCYLYLCVDVGRPPPPSALASLAAAADEPLSVSLADGSAIVAWQGTLEPLFDGGAPTLTAAGVITDELAESVGLVGLEPPSAGAWLLTIKVYFDRERGSMTYGYRVVAE